MYKFLNLHPQKKIVADCVKRTFAAATDTPYEQIAKELNELKKQTGCKKFNAKTNWKEYIKIRGWKKITFKAEAGKPRMNGKRFMEEYTKGTYVLQMAHHLTVCKNGNIFDTWDCTNKCVYAAWRV